jgi:hypothetical protein
MIQVNDQQSRRVSPKNGSVNSRKPNQYAGGNEVSRHQHYDNSVLNRNF